MPVYANKHGWVLETANSAYALGLNNDGLLVHRYWGARLPDLADYPASPDSGEWASFNGPAHMLPEEYPAWGGGPKYIEPCLKATFADGTRTVELRFMNTSISENGDTLRITLEDTVYKFRVLITYVVHEHYDLIERFASIGNYGNESVTLERAFSAQWHPPAGHDYRMTHLNGRWNDEWHIRRDKLPHGTTRLESRRIMTGHQHNPYFALDDGSATEESGEVYFGALAWSGNWALTAEVTDFDTTRTRVSIGYNDWDFAYRLEGGQSLMTRSAYAGWTDGGFGAASRILHDYIRERVLPHGAISHKVLYNSWEATLFAVDEQSQTKLAEIAADIGIELFVMDDGWFKGRNSDKAGLGDWTPDPSKFPHGLKPLIDKVNALGMDFGIWIEPEMINPDSDLYRAHPEWVIHFPTRQRTTARNQLMLNLAREDVQAYLIERLDWLLSEHNITFIKWDANRNVSEPGWHDAPGDPREIWVRYVEGLYHVWGTLQKKHPSVIFQSCSGGGGRADLGILAYADQVWVSDNTEATSRLAIQDGFSQMFPASIMEAWVTDAGVTPLDFRCAVSMAGALGVGANLLHWNAAEREAARKWIALYKDIREVVQLGNQYRLLTVQGGTGYSAVQYMAKDGSEGVLFVFRTHLSEPTTFPTLHLRGLDADARYTIEGIEGARTGTAWANAGVKVPIAGEVLVVDTHMEYLSGDFRALILRIRRI